MPSHCVSCAGSYMRASKLSTVDRPLERIDRASEADDGGQPEGELDEDFSHGYPAAL